MSFARTVKTVNNWLERVGLGILIKDVKVKIEKPGKVSGYYDYTVCLDIEDAGRGHSLLAIPTQSYLYLHELGHHFQEKILNKKERKALRPIFGNLDSEYERNFDLDDDSPIQSFASWYAMVHPMDDFSETFALYLYLGMRTKSRGAWRKHNGKDRIFCKKLDVMESLIRTHRK